MSTFHTSDSEVSSDLVELSDSDLESVTGGRRSYRGGRGSRGGRGNRNVAIAQNINFGGRNVNQNANAFAG